MHSVRVRARGELLENQQSELRLELDQAKATLQLASDAAAQEVSARLAAEVRHDQAMSMVKTAHDEALEQARGEAARLAAAQADALSEVARAVNFFKLNC